MNSLVKGQRLSFAKENPDLRSIVLNVQWNIKGNSRALARELEADMSAFLLDQAGRCKADSDIVFYGNTSGRGGAVIHTGKNQRGTLVDEGLTVELPKMPNDVEKIALTLSIYEGEPRGQDFSMVESISIAVLDGRKGLEICHFDVNWDFTIETGIVLCELYKKNGEWRFNAVGAGYQGGLAALCKSFGLDVHDEQGSTKEQVASNQPMPRPLPPSPKSPPPPPPRLMNEPLTSGNAGIRIGGNRQINLGNPQSQVHLNSSNPSGVSSTPAPRKFNFSPQNVVPSTPPSPLNHSVPPNLLRCRCGAALRSNSNFCTGCGTPVIQQQLPPIPQGEPAQQYCTNCRNVLRPGSKFCTRCGKRV